MAVTSPKCCFWDIILSHADLPVARFEIDFGEDRGALEAVEEFLCAEDGVSIIDCLFVEGAEVNAKAESTPFLTNKKNWRAIWGFGRFDEAASEEVGELDPAFVEFCDGESVRREEWRRSRGIGDGDGVVNSWTVWRDVSGWHAAEDVSVGFECGGHEGLVSVVSAA